MYYAPEHDLGRLKSTPSFFEGLYITSEQAAVALVLMWKVFRTTLSFWLKAG